MDNDAPPPGKGWSRAGTKPRPSEPVDPRTETVESDGNSDDGARRGSSGQGNGASAGAPGRKPKRRLSPTALLRPREPVIDAPDAEAPPVAADLAPDSTAAVSTIMLSATNGPVLLPPIRTSEPASANGEPALAKEAPNRAPAAAQSADSAGPAVREAAPAPAVTPAALVPTVSAPSRVMPFIRPPAPPEVAPGELVARKVVAPPEGTAVLDVPLDPDPTGEQPFVARIGRPSITFQRRRTRPRVRRVTRVVRHSDTWSVFKVALVFNAFLYAVTLTAGVLLWHVAIATGTVDNVERFFEGFGWQSFKFKGGEIFHNAWVGGLFVAIGLTGFAVLLATMFNLITDLVGGIRVSVLEEEVLARRDRTAKVVVEDDPEEAAPYDQARSG